MDNGATMGCEDAGVVVPEVVDVDGEEVGPEQAMTFGVLDG
jgi:hypothetical protein